MRNKERLFRTGFILISILLVCAIIILIYNFRLGKKEDKSEQVGVVLIGDPEDNGWNEGHYKGVEAACIKHSCTMHTASDVPEEEEAIKEAVSSLAQKGCSCIFLTSYGYGGFADAIAQAYPDIAFYCISGEADARNCGSYFARMYQARYLTGIVAGAATESNVLGYVAAMSIPETVRSINAYCMGARKANPDVRVLVRFTGSWDDREAEEAATRELIEAGADVMTFHEDRPYAIELADKMGVYSTGYDYVSGDYSERFLTAAVFNWDMLYSRVLGDFLSGRADFSNHYWLGLSDEAVSLYPYSKLVSEQTKELVSRETDRIKNLGDVFSGEITDNTGAVRCNENERIGDDELFNSIDWYVQGVEICE